MKKICVLGLGYIGLPTASLFALNDFQVIGVDINEKHVNNINNKVISFKEEDLIATIIQALDKKTLTPKTEIEQADIFIIAVPTPLNKEEKKANLDYVISATNSISTQLKKGNLIILESTVPPRTSVDIIIPLLEKTGLKAGEDFHFAHCPERAIPGNTLNEIINNDRIIGGYNRESKNLTKELYSSFVKGNIFLTDLTTAEMVKLTENTSRDVNIALANELMQISNELKINVNEVIKLANLHPRVNILNPGPGVGGHCIPVDPWFIHEKASNNAKLIPIARNINDETPNFVVKTIESILNNKKGKISIFGAAYKGNTEDTRESPAIPIINSLKEKGHIINIYDPYVDNFEPSLTDLDNCISDSNCLVFLTDHNNFKELNIKEIASRVKEKNLLDTKNFLNHNLWKEEGFKVNILGDTPSNN